MKKLPVSVCMIAGAEAHRIRPALESVAGWTSELIVLLNEEVNDGTDRVAAEFGARLFREPWKGFVGQKNSVSAKATQPWILGLDADERVTPDLRDEVAASLAGRADAQEIAAFEFPRCTFYCGRWIRHGDWYPDRVTRLWRREAAVWEGIEPHAYLRVRGRVAKLRNDLLHFSNENIDRQIAKIGPYSDYFVQHRLRQGRQARMMDLTVRPLWRFLRAYIFRLGFLDGWPGYYIACLTAFSTVTRYAKVREAQRSKDPAP